MKRIQFLAVIMMALLVASCGKKKQTEDIIVKPVETPAPQGPVSMQPYNQVTDVKWLDRDYQVAINRVANDTLPTVTDENGQKFVDNTITVRVLRSDGSVFFSRSFTKTSFKEQLDDDYRHTGILEGIVFDKVDGNHLVLAGSVSHPQTDEYIPIVMTISNFGDVSIRRDDQMDTTGNLPAEEASNEDGV